MRHPCEQMSASVSKQEPDIPVVCKMVFRVESLELASHRKTYGCSYECALHNLNSQQVWSALLSRSTVSDFFSLPPFLNSCHIADGLRAALAESLAVEALPLPIGDTGIEFGVAPWAVGSWNSGGSLACFDGPEQVDRFAVCALRSCVDSCRMHPGLPGRVQSQF